MNKKCLCWLTITAFVLLAGFIGYLWKDAERTSQILAQRDELEKQNDTLKKAFFKPVISFQIERLGVNANQWQVPTLLGGTIEIVLPIPQLPGINACIILNGQDPAKLALIPNGAKGVKAICREYSLQYQEKGSGKTNTFTVIAGEMVY